MLFPDFDKHIRLLDTRTDMLEVADLIEISFGSQLDPDSLNYLDHIRKAALDHNLVRWMYAAGEMISYPLNGYVCEIDGMVVGNLSIIPFYWKHNWYYLIANVAVHPDFRQRGIAHALTAKALEHIRNLPIHAVWLHVREDNLQARHLYESFQFITRCTRDTWISTDMTNNLNDFVPGIHIVPPYREEWPDLLKWFDTQYPPEVVWNLGFDIHRQKPGILTSLVQLFSENKPPQWNIYIKGKLSGSAILRKSNAYADQVFLAYPIAGDDRTISSLLTYIKCNYSKNRNILVNFPSRLADHAFQQAGFELVNRLIWMEIRING